MPHSPAPPLGLALALQLAMLAAAPAAAHGDRADYNRSLNSVHQPVVSRTDYSFDLAVGPQGLAPGEAQRLSGWFDGLALGYGDTVTIDEAGGTQGDRGRDSVGAVLSRYGMLLSAEGAPTSVGHPAAGIVRVVVSRAVARVEGCPNWTRGNFSAEYDGANTSNYGCASAQNLAAMIANPEDLVHGVRGGPTVDPRISVKAVSTWQDAKTTGAAGLPGGVTAASVVKGSN